MTQAMNLLAASSRPTKTYNQTVGVAAEVASDAQSCVVFSIETHPKLQIQVPTKHRRMAEITKGWEKDATRRSAMAVARQWAAAELHGGDGDTVRTLRMRKGWSQTQLAESIGTSQSHVARIERGDQNLAIQTCRRLADMLGIDMNAMDSALRKQEELALAKSAK